MRLGIDLDDVMVDFTAAWLPIYNRGRRADVPLCRGDLTGWDITTFTDFESADELWQWMGDAVLGAWAMAPPINGALPGVRQLDADGHDVVIITSKRPGWEWVAYQWLADHRVGVREVHVTSDKAAVPACDIYLDDGPHNLAAYKAAHPDALVVRFTQPWNRPGVADMTAESWPDFLDIVREIEEEGGAFDSHALAVEWEDVSVAQRIPGEGERLDGAEVRVVNAQTGGEKGQKLARFDLLPWGALWRVAEHYGIGARKYADHNWRRGYDWSLSIGALARHLALFADGEDADQETGSPHPAAIAFHALALLTFMDERRELDDRPRKDVEAPHSEHSLC